MDLSHALYVIAKTNKWSDGTQENLWQFYRVFVTCPVHRAVHIASPLFVIRQKNNLFLFNLYKFPSKIAH